MGGGKEARSMDVVIVLRANWERITGWALVAFGLVLLAAGAAQVAGAKFLVDQLSFLASGGIGGLACVALGSALLLSSALHDDWRRLERIEAVLREGPAVAGPAALTELNLSDTLPPEASSGNGSRAQQLRTGRS